MVIGICGWIGSGKDTVAEYLVSKYGFERASFASTLKDSVSSVFGWDRNLLEGLTPEARAWREEVDQWWANRLNIPHLTPRWVLQQWGTEVCRKSFHDDIWIASVENKLRHIKNNVVISDCRFKNEINSIKNSGGMVIWVQRGPLPEWYGCAINENTTHEDDLWMLEDAGELMEQKYPRVHASEWKWVGSNFDAVLDNNKNLEQLYNQIDLLVNSSESKDLLRKLVLDLI